VALDHGVVGRARGAAGEGVGVTVVGGPACGYAAADMADRLGAGVGVVGVGVGGGDGLVGGCRGHGTCGGNRLAVHCLVADLGIGVGDGLGLDLVGCWATGWCWCWCGAGGADAGADAGAGAASGTGEWAASASEDACSCRGLARWWVSGGSVAKKSGGKSRTRHVGEKIKYKE
jgi:hypothetical protein